MKKLLIVLVVIGVGLAAGAYWLRPPAKNDVAYTFAPTERGTLVDAVTATGLLQPSDVAIVMSQVPGIVVAIDADINQHVEKGQMLLKLDDRAPRLKLEQAQEALALAQDQLTQAQGARDTAQKGYDEQKELVDQKVAFKKDLIVIEGQLKAARAAVAGAKDQIQQARTAIKLAQLGLDLTQVTAPMSGTIIDKKVFIGQPVGPASSGGGNSGPPGPADAGAARPSGGAMAGGPLFIIARDLDKVRVHAQVGEGDIAKVARRQRATFTVYAYSDKEDQFEGKVTEIHPTSTNVMGAVFYDTVIVAENRRASNSSREWMLRPGMTADVSIIRRTHHNVWKMPTAALNFQLDAHYQTETARNKVQDWEKRPDVGLWQYVWVLKDDKPWPIFVRTGGAGAAGDTGISDGQYKEVLQWDPELPAPNPDKPDTYPQVIIAAPPVREGGLFGQPAKLKLS